MPKKFNNYYEPFVGGGAILLAIQPQKALINDINDVLINAFEIVKKSPKELVDMLQIMDHFSISKDDYYYFRNLFNQKLLNHELDLFNAALFIYLNKRCFNGLYRVNSKGLFNVPFNNKAKIQSADPENLLKLSEFLQNVQITNVDFEEAVKDAQPGDFIFFDSPYAPLKATSFDSYTKEGFSYDDHVRLSSVFKKLDQKGCFVMITNNNTDLIQELYKDYKIEVLQTKRLINSKGDKRFGEELIITNY